MTTAKVKDNKGDFYRIPLQLLAKFREDKENGDLINFLKYKIYASKKNAKSY